MKKVILVSLMAMMLVGLPFLAASGSAESSKVFELRFACPFQEIEPPGIFSNHFMDQVEKESGGRVTFKRYHGGVLGTVPEQLELISSGSVDAGITIIFMYREDMPLHTYPPMVLGDAESALDYQRKLDREIPETAAILRKECEENNIITLNQHDMGEDGIIAKKVFHTIAELKGKKVGVYGQQASLPQVGISVVSMQIPDMYESLSRGVVDALTMALSPMAILKWHEVSKCYMSLNENAVGQPICVNLDTWKSLPPDLQKIFQGAADATTAFSIEFTEKSLEQVRQTFRDAGLVVGKLNKEDTELLYRLNHESQISDMRENAAKAGKSAEAEIIIKHVNQLLFGE